MTRLPKSLNIAVVTATWLIADAPTAVAQRPEGTVVERENPRARGGAGFVIGTWKVEDPTAPATDFSDSPYFAIQIQRGLDRRLALEHSASVWRRVIQEVQSLPLGDDRIVEVKSYVLPLITSLRFYPFTTPTDVLEPYIGAGIGFALGISDEAENAIGGGGTAIATGFGIKVGIGVEFHITNAIGVVAGGRFQWTRFGEDLGSQDTFRGTGFDGGLTYRFPY